MLGTEGANYDRREEGVSSDLTGLRELRVTRKEEMSSGLTSSTESHLILAPANQVPFHHATAFEASAGVLYPTKANLRFEYTLTSVIAAEAVEVEVEGEDERWALNDSSVE